MADIPIVTVQFCLDMAGNVGTQSRRVAAVSLMDETLPENKNVFVTGEGNERNGHLIGGVSGRTVLALLRHQMLIFKWIHLERNLE